MISWLLNKIIDEKLKVDLLLFDERQETIDDIFGFLIEFIYNFYATSATHLLAVQCGM